MKMESEEAPKEPGGCRHLFCDISPKITEKQTTACCCVRAGTVPAFLLCYNGENKRKGRERRHLFCVRVAEINEKETTGRCHEGAGKLPAFVWCYIGEN